MPEPRETHTAIDARRNAPRGGGGDVHELALLLAQHQRLDAPGGKCSCGHETALGDLTSRHVADAILAAGWVPPERLAEANRRIEQSGEVHRETVERMSERYHRATDARDALAATVQRVRDLCDRHYGRGGVPDSFIRQIRTALAPSDPATEEATDGT